MAEQVVFPPSAQCDELDEALVRDVLHKETDFVHVTGDQHARTLTGEIAEHRAHAIGVEITAVAEFIDKNRADLVLVTWHRMGFGEFAQQ